MNTSHQTPPPRGRAAGPAFSARRSTTAALLAAFALATLATPPLRAGISTSELPQVGYHCSSINFYSPIRLGNALAIDDRGWRAVSPKPGGQSWETVSAAPATDQLDDLGNPLYLGTGQLYLQAMPGEQSFDKAFLTGRIVVTWEGEADVRLGTGTFLANGDSSIPSGQPQSNGTSTGLINNGQRVYNVTGQPNGLPVRVYAISSDSTKKPKNIKVWLADPSTGNSLKGQFWHPKLISRINENSWGHIRFMDLACTNGNPQQDWTDRRNPAHTFQTGVINNRSPGGGYSGDRLTGVAWEHMVALCNATDKDLWINVPHMATDDYITKMAQVIAFGSAADGTPYTSTQSTTPAYPPLNSGLKVFIEYSNEIWSNGKNFPQGDWAASQASAAGITKAQFNARRFCQAWKIFQTVFGSADRLVKVAAIWTGDSSYTTAFLNEIKSYGPTLSPAQEPDLIAGTTYFGNGIQDWAEQKARDQIGATDSWFYTTDTWQRTVNSVTTTQPVSKPSSDAYWTSTALDTQIDQTFDEWTRRLLSGSNAAGSGPDANNTGGGIRDWLRPLAQNTFSTAKPVLAYEGGPSIYTDTIDLSGEVQDDGVTNFMSALNRRSRMAEVYRIHLNMAKAKGLWSHMMFTDAGAYGKYGQWGHLENSLGAANSASPKYQFMLDWTQEANALRHIDNPSGAVPSFSDIAMLPTAYIGKAYSKTLTTTGGDGARTSVIIGKSMSPGLTASVSNGNVVVSGTPTAAGFSFVYVRVTDADGDPAWRVFNLNVVDPTTRRFVQGTDTNNLVSMESENAQVVTNVAGSDGVSRSWELRSSQTDASGGQARKARPDDTNVNYSTVADMNAYSPLLRFNVEFVKSGVHYAYIRCKAEDESGSGNASADSIHVGFDGARLTSDSGVGLSSSYSWKTVTLPELTPGVHTFDIWMRENGAVVDKVVLSTNSSASALGLTSTSYGAAESSQNLGSGYGSISAYSSQQTGNEVAKLIDGIEGDDSNRWSASGSGYPQWVEIDLGANRTVNSIVLDTYLNRAYKFKVEAKTAGGTYGGTPLVDKTANTAAGPISVTLSTATSARYIKLTVTGATNYTGSWVSIREFKILGQP